MNHHEWHLWDLGRAFHLREHWHLWLRHNGDVYHVTKILSSEVTPVFSALSGRMALGVVTPLAPRRP